MIYFFSVDYLGDILNRVVSGFHFYDDYSTVFFCNDVNFVFSASPVSVTDEVATFEKCLKSGLFSFLSENVMLGHCLLFFFAQYHLTILAVELC